MFVNDATLRTQFSRSDCIVAGVCDLVFLLVDPNICCVYTESLLMLVFLIKSFVLRQLIKHHF